MMKQIQKILNVWFVLAVNAVLIVLIWHGGNYALKSGLVHGIAVIFVILAVIAIANRTVEDKFLHKFLYLAPITALFLFAAGHSLEFIEVIFKVGILPDDTHFVNVMNLQIGGLLLIVSAAWYLVDVYTNKGSRTLPIIFCVFSGIMVLLTLTAFFTGWDLSLSPAGALPYIYSAMTIIIAVLGITILLKIRKVVPVLERYVRYFLAAFLFMVIAIFFVIFNNTLPQLLHMPRYEIIYIAHFALYLSLSFLFLTSRKLSDTSPFYAELEQFSKQQ